MTTAPIRPSDGELAILRVLWSRGPSTVRDVHTELSKDRDMGYTTVLKLMQIMVEKGLVARDERARSHTYRTLQGEAETQRCLLKELLQKAFAGNRRELVLQALETEPASAEELEDIRKLLNDAKGRAR
ncbi:BlaI/MecI/CopY family transcriptional regulator [Geothrix edaphica]|jgi:predicted transcriptional regulator|uniref:Transcriptional regulator n=1 Tax=Geothrix edaphica TaxID=2927976 RepID=A0ABQ5PWE3_9BACT|nr:BlaI/MecI/CopY family transcriptional regulator [Geothrix edaphica]GLH66693.1 transcriptional regulator [Geothrix edaphica]